MKNEKICFVISTVGTAKVFLSDHIEQLSKEFDVFLVGNFSKSDLPYLNKLKIIGFHSIEIHRKINLIEDIKSVLKLRKYFKKEKFLAVHSVTPKAGLISALSGKLAGVENRIHIFTGQVWYTRTGFLKQLLIFIDKIIALLNTQILVDGESQRKFLIQKGILKASNSSVLGKGSISGVNIKRFQPNAEERMKLRKELKLSNKIVFGFMGRFNRDKGIIELYEAFNKLIEQNPMVHLLFIGYDEENMLSHLPAYLNIREGYNFTNFGPTNEPEKILQAIDVFCLPSHREGFGTSVLEASCLGIPIICSDTYGLMDAMIDGKTGLRHKVCNSEDLYLKMKQLAENKEMRDTIGKNCHEFVNQNFSGSMITQEWINFYRQLSN